jgi:hypothetical protein
MAVLVQIQIREAAGQSRVWSAAKGIRKWRYYCRDAVKQVLELTKFRLGSGVTLEGALPGMKKRPISYKLRLNENICARRGRNDRKSGHTG